MAVAILRSIPLVVIFFVLLKKRPFPKTNFPKLYFFLPFPLLCSEINRKEYLRLTYDNHPQA